MNTVETLEQFYDRKFKWIPENVRKDIGHFNMFHLEPVAEGKSIPYRRRDFYKIMLLKSNTIFHYADKAVEIKSNAVVFSNPNVPYQCEFKDLDLKGVYCIFNEHFFNQFGRFDQYEVFQPEHSHVFELTDEQVDGVEKMFEKIETEFNSDYKYRFDAIRNQIFELLHFALKLNPTSQLDLKPMNASKRISMLFMELLERQFPIDDDHRSITLRTPSDFASNLNVHVNHLNRAVKETTQKTTTQIISERLVQEAKVLLKHTTWNVSEIAYALGFTEVTHFNNFFKKHIELSPLKFRND
jgi:AraC family transcriptional activator of pobA